MELCELDGTGFIFRDRDGFCMRSRDCNQQQRGYRQDYANGVDNSRKRGVSTINKRATRQARRKTETDYGIG